MDAELYKEAFVKTFMQASSRAAKAVKETKKFRHTAIDNINNTLHGTLLDVMAENGAYGAEPIRTGLNKARKAISDADTYLGALAAGKHWKSKAKGGIRRSLFVDEKDTYIPLLGKKKWPLIGKQQHLRHFRTPSITAPVSDLAYYGVPILALQQGVQLMHGKEGTPPT